MDCQSIPGHEERQEMTLEETERRERLADELWEAIESEDVPRVQALLAEGCDPDVWGDENRYGDLPLQAAACVGGEKGLALVEALVRAGADIDHQGDFMATALHRAVYDDRNDDWATARFLVRSGASCSLWDKNGLTAPEAANNEGHDAAVVALLDSGMDPTVHGCAGSLLWYVAWSSPFLVRELLKRGCPADFTKAPPAAVALQTPLGRALEAHEHYGGTAAHTAETIRLLLAAGADPAKVGAHLPVLEKLLFDDAFPPPTGQGKERVV